jgi:uncharacterized protein YecA (UPF0149 family)
VGAIAEAIVAYAQPFLDETDGSVEGMNRALSIAQMCWNFALLPEDQREAAINEIQPALNMTDADFAEFRQRLILPMIARHHEMFPGLHGRLTQVPQVSRVSNTVAAVPSPRKTPPRTDRYAPCPCGSGRKYKFCCGAPK